MESDRNIAHNRNKHQILCENLCFYIPIVVQKDAGFSYPNSH